MQALCKRGDYTPRDPPCMLVDAETKSGVSARIHLNDDCALEHGRAAGREATQHAVDRRGDVAVAYRAHDLAKSHMVTDTPIRREAPRLRRAHDLTPIGSTDEVCCSGAASPGFVYANHAADSLVTGRNYNVEIFFTHVIAADADG